MASPVLQQSGSPHPADTTFKLRQCQRAQEQLLQEGRGNPWWAIREKSGSRFKEILRTWSLWEQRHRLYCSHLKGDFRKTFALNSLINVSYFLVFFCSHSTHVQISLVIASPACHAQRCQNHQVHPGYGTSSHTYLWFMSAFQWRRGAGQNKITWWMRKY